jgi:hypothetical protein
MMCHFKSGKYPGYAPLIQVSDSEGA